MNDGRPVATWACCIQIRVRAEIHVRKLMELRVSVLSLTLPAVSDLQSGDALSKLLTDLSLTQVVQDWLAPNVYLFGWVGGTVITISWKRTCSYVFLIGWVGGRDGHYDFMDDEILWGYGILNDKYEKQSTHKKVTTVFILVVIKVLFLTRYFWIVNVV